MWAGRPYLENVKKRTRPRPHKSSGAGAVALGFGVPALPSPAAPGGEWKRGGRGLGEGGKGTSDGRLLCRLPLLKLRTPNFARSSSLDPQRPNSRFRSLLFFQVGPRGIEFGWERKSASCVYKLPCNTQGCKAAFKLPSSGNSVAFPLCFLRVNRHAGKKAVRGLRPRPLP